MKVTVVVFPGSNCDHDAAHAFGPVLGGTITEVWHRDRDLGNPDLVVIPGGSSFGDYLRTGAMAKLSPVMASVSKFAENGGKVLGICNGFQILCEAGLLPGVLLENIGQRFLSQYVSMKVEPNKSFLAPNIPAGTVIHCPIAHFQGNYFADPAELESLEHNNQVVFRYCDSKGNVDPQSRTVNVNGSCNAIAGICNKAGNVVGLMPHPERSAEQIVSLIGAASGRSVIAAAVA